MIVRENIAGWFFSYDINDVRIAKEIGLPLMLHQAKSKEVGLPLWQIKPQSVSVCLPVCYKNHYNQLAAKHGVMIEWI